MPKLISELGRFALAEEKPLIRQAILRQIGLLTNKFLPARRTEEVLHMIRNVAAGILGATMVSENAVRILFWEAKGLVLRLSHTDEVLECLLTLLSHPEYGPMCARGFGLLLASDEVLTRENGANVRLLAKQKVFNICMPAINKAFRNAKTTTKPNYLVALSGLLKNMPTEIIMPELDTLLPLLLQSLDLEDSGVKAATIQSLTVIAGENPKVVEGHIGSLVSRLVKSAISSQVNTASVRHNALTCLRTFPGNVKDSTLLPYRNSVTGGLWKILDDPKRHVRKEAVECRAVWSNMDEPQSD